MRLLKVLFVLIIFLPIASVLGAVFGPNYIDWNTQKPRLEKMLKSKSGFDVHLLGDVDFKVFPQTYLRVGGVEVDAFDGKNKLFTAKDIQLDLSFTELMQLRLSVERFYMDEPKIHLTKTDKGVANWQPKRTKRGGRSSGGALAYVDSIGDVVISNGALVYEDDARALRYDVKGAQLTISPEDDGDARVKVSARVNDVPLEMTMNTNLNMMSSVPVDATIGAEGNTIVLDGRLIGALGSPAYSGKIKLEGPTLLGMYYKLQHVPFEQTQFSAPLYLSGDLDWNMYETELRDFTLGFNAEKKETLAGRFTYRGEEREKGATLNAKIIAKNGLDLNALGVCQRGSSRSDSSPQGWSDELIDTTVLTHLDADIELTLNGFVCGDRQPLDVVVRASNAQGVLSLSDARLISGKGEARITGRIDVNKGIEARTIGVRLKAFPVEALLPPEKAKFLSLPLDGSGEFRAKGKTQAELVSSLEGNLKAHSEDAQLRMSLQGLQNAITMFLKGGGRSDAKHAATFESVFEVEGGVFKTAAIQMKGANFTLNGSGKIDLNHRAINYRVQPKIDGASKLSIPLLIKGPLDAPKVLPDIVSAQGVATGVGAALGGPAGAAIGNAIGTMLGGDGRDKALDEPKPEGLPFDLENQDSLEENVHKYLNSQE